MPPGVQQTAEPRKMNASGLSSQELLKRWGGDSVNQGRETEYFAKGKKQEQLLGVNGRGNGEVRLDSWEGNQINHVFLDAQCCALPPSTDSWLSSNIHSLLSQ